MVLKSNTDFLNSANQSKKRQSILFYFLVVLFCVPTLLKLKDDPF